MIIRMTGVKNIVIAIMCCAFFQSGSGQQFPSVTSPIPTIPMSYNFKLPYTPYVKIYLKNNETVTGKFSIKYRNPAENEGAILTVNKRKIVPQETDSIITRFLTGFPWKTCWIFKVIEGKISVYSKIPDPEVSYIDFIQKDDAEIQPYSYTLLKEFVRDDTVATSYILQNENPKKKSHDDSYKTYTKHEIIYAYNKSKGDLAEEKWASISENKGNSSNNNQTIIYDVKVCLKNGTCMIGSSAFYFNSEVVIRGKSITPDETDSVIVDFLTGVPDGSHWLFKVLSGKIKAFSYSPYQEEPKIEFIQKKDAEMQKYNFSLLRGYIKDDTLLAEKVRRRESQLNDVEKKANVEQYKPHQIINDYNNEYLKRSIEIKKQFDLQQKQKDPGFRTQILQSIIEKDVTYYNAYFVLGEIALSNNDIGAAYEHFTNALRYSDSMAFSSKIRKKIKSLNQIPLY